ncbi:post-transcriptional regulator [Sporosarcina beigongshangi]|uniref:post-transcriptional regulator n=1 Tax=Sporosarcina beigongshangi TaxID=2782538 RepID=UPI00193A8C1F|nr:post-transcriptional regulator [Sporosarcina beigongshangi]
MTRQYEPLFTQMLPVIESKKTEFHLYGYPTITNEDIWTFCVQKKWRKKEIETMKIHEMVNEILRVTPAEFMTFTHIEEQRGSDNWFADLNNEEFRTLLAPVQSKEEI